MCSPCPHAQPLRFALPDTSGEAVRQALPLIQSVSGFTLELSFESLDDLVAAVLRQKNSPPGAPMFDAWGINNVKVRGSGLPVSLRRFDSLRAQCNA